MSENQTWSFNAVPPGSLVMDKTRTNKLEGFMGIEQQKPDLHSELQNIMNWKRGASVKEFSNAKPNNVRRVASLNIEKSEESKMLGEIAMLNTLSIRFGKFKTILEQPNVDLDQLKKLSWSGIPDDIRPTCWRLLMGYLPVNSDRRDVAMLRKRKEYDDFVNQSFSKGIEGLDQQLYHQIHIDVQRTNSNIPLYQNTLIQQALERILYCWAIRHPASSYVQGINDLCIPFFQVFIQPFLTGLDMDNLSQNDPIVPSEILEQVEADTYWCLGKLLDGIQDHYTFSQPGIQRQCHKLQDLIQRIDAPLNDHLQKQGILYIQFAFRWINCLLTRELNLQLIIRMWDTLMAEGSDGFSDFSLYVCGSFLVKFSDRLKKMEFQELMMFLQNLPTSHWSEKEVELILSEAFMWKSLFHNSNHIKT